MSTQATDPDGLEVRILPTGMIQTNCVILQNHADEILVFDPGADDDKIAHVIDELGGKVIGYPLTHGHYDHICALHLMMARHPAPASMHPLDLEWAFTSPYNNNLPWYKQPEENERPEVAAAYETERVETIGSFSFETLFLPGHSPGSVGFYFRRHNLLIGGDVLFKGSMGRTDLPGGNHMHLLASLRKLMDLPNSTTVIAGHGETTTIGSERRSNPFVQEALSQA